MADPDRTTRTVPVRRRRPGPLQEEHHVRTHRHTADGARRPARLLAALTAATVALGGLALAGTSAQAAPQPAAQPATVAAAAAPGHQWLTGYWHNFNNGSVVMPLSD